MDFLFVKVDFASKHFFIWFLILIAVHFHFKKQLFFNNLKFSIPQ